MRFQIFRVFIFPTFLFLLSSCSLKNKETSIGNDTSVYSELLITLDGAGYFKKGMSLTEIKKKHDIIMTDVKNVEGDLEPLYITDESTIFLEIKYDTDTRNFTDIVDRILVVGEKYKTKKGIGVNSTLADFKDKYPDAKIFYYISGEPWLETRDESISNLQFVLDFVDHLNKSVDVKDGDLIELDINDFKADAKIKMIRIY